MLPALKICASEREATVTPLQRSHSLDDLDDMMLEQVQATVACVDELEKVLGV
jgi:hypothetical protein